MTLPHKPTGPGQEPTELMDAQALTKLREAAKVPDVTVEVSRAQLIAAGAIKPGRPDDTTAEMDQLEIARLQTELREAPKPAKSEKTPQKGIQTITLTTRQKEQQLDNGDELIVKIEGRWAKMKKAKGEWLGYNLTIEYMDGEKAHMWWSRRNSESQNQPIMRAQVMDFIPGGELKTKEELDIALWAGQKVMCQVKRGDETWSEGYIPFTPHQNGIYTIKVVKNGKMGETDGVFVNLTSFKIATAEQRAFYGRDRGTTL